MYGKGKIIVANDVLMALEYAGIAREALVDTGLKFIRRSINDGKYYYIVNHTAKSVDATLPIQTVARAVVIMDPQSGSSGLASFTRRQNATDVRLQLKPGEALILKTTTGRTPGLVKWKYMEALQPSIKLEGSWSLSFKDGGPSIPAARTLKH